MVGTMAKIDDSVKKKVPELRFKGFTDEWEERKLGDIAPLRGGFAFKSSKFRNTGVPIVRISYHLKFQVNKYIILVKESAFLKITLWRVLWKKQKKVVQLRF